MTIIYALSGIALNHIKDWNPSYIIDRNELIFTGNVQGSAIEIDKAKQLLKDHNIEDAYKSHYFPTQNELTIFTKTGTFAVDLLNNKATYETVTRRPIFFEVNFLHYNPGALWMWFSDIYAVGLIIISITGLFILKGKNGLKGRGGWLTGLGIVLPLIFLFMYL